MARASKKEINLEIYGEETELDARWLANRDPLFTLSVILSITELRPKVRIARGSQK